MIQISFSEMFSKLNNFYLSKGGMEINNPDS